MTRGSNAADEPDIDLPDAAVRLGRFVAALERIDTTGGPPSFRGGPVGMLDDRVRGEIRDLGADSTLDPGLAIAACETARAAPEWDGDPVWVHADLSAEPAGPPSPADRSHRLRRTGLGYPAIDMLPAWEWLTAQTRGLFRAETRADDATWARGRGWGLGLGLGAANFYRDSNPALAAIGRYAISEAITDYQGTR